MAGQGRMKLDKNVPKPAQESLCQCCWQRATKRRRTKTASLQKFPQTESESKLGMKSSFRTGES